MKKIILSCFLAGTMMSHAQTEIFTDDFETTANWAFSAQTGAGNEFVIDDNYIGGTFTFGATYVIPDVPSQPVTFSNPDMNYLHPVNVIATLNGVNNSSYTTGGTEVVDASNNTDISTVGYENIEISFWRTGGANGLELIYSEDGGSSWTPAVIVMLVNPSGWEESTFTFPSSVENISDFRIGFRLTETNLTDPSPNHYHSIDEITITGDPTTPPEELTATVQNPPAYFCGEEDITVDYTGTNGTYNAANEFQLELSDDAGDFTSPTVIGSIASTNATGSITGTIPMGITSGTGYRVRVVSTDNAFTGDDNGTDLTLHPKPAAPVITQNGLDLQSDYANGNQWYLDGAPIAGEENQDLTADESGSYTVVHTSVEGCESDPSNPIVIDFTNTLNEVKAAVKLFPNPFENNLNVKNADGFDQLKVVDVTGKVVHKQSLSNSDNEINTGKWESGIYFVRLSGENTSKTFKVLKR